MSNTGFKAYTNLEQYYVDNGIATGITKPNSISDPDYIAPVYDTIYCPLPSLSATPTPTVSTTPSITPTVTPTVTPTITPTPSTGILPSISLTPSTTPSISITPSITPTVTVTPSITPSLSGNPALIYKYVADRYICTGGSINYFETIVIENTVSISPIEVGKYYFDTGNCAIFQIVTESIQAPSLFTIITDPPVIDGSSLCYSLC